MKTNAVIIVSLFFGVWSLVGMAGEKTYGCAVGQTCSLHVEVNSILSCDMKSGDSWCTETFHNPPTILDCTGEPSCESVTSSNRQISCRVCGTSCCTTWLDSKLSCCSGGGGGGGDPPPPQCVAPDVVVYYSPAQIVCRQPGECYYGIDGVTGGESGTPVDDPLDECGGSSVKCMLGNCAPSCTPVCGDTANGCGYGQIGCGGTCTPNLACSWPNWIQGRKWLEPGNNMAGPQSSQVVSLASPVVSDSANPFFLQYNSTAGANRAVSVQPLDGYDIAWSLCYNDFSCHTNPATWTAGRNATVSDDLIRAAGNMVQHPYANKVRTSITVTGFVRNR